MIGRLLLAAAICSATLPLGQAALAAGLASADEQAVLKLDADWADAEMRRDGATLERILDNRFIATFAGKSIDKPTFIRALLSEDPAKVVTQKLSDRTVIVEQDTAVVVETDTETIVKDAKTTVNTWRFTVTYIKRQGRWVALAEQGGPA
jgi:hypothetical protein